MHSKAGAPWDVEPPRLGWPRLWGPKNVKAIPVEIEFAFLLLPKVVGVLSSISRVSVVATNHERGLVAQSEDLTWQIPDTTRTDHAGGTGE